MPLVQEKVCPTDLPITDGFTRHVSEVVELQAPMP